MTVDDVLVLIGDTLQAKPAAITLSTRATDLEAWDSMGTMNLLLALHGACGLAGTGRDRQAPIRGRRAGAASQRGEAHVNAYLRGVHYHLPKDTLTNEDLVRNNPSWDTKTIFRKTGIRCRRVCAPEETSLDLAVLAAEKLLGELDFDRGRCDALLFCTQTSDYMLPSAACLLQDRLGLPTTCAALEFKQGCSGFTYGLWWARALIVSRSAQNVLLLAADTLSKFCDPHDMGTVTIFGDGAGAALITNNQAGAKAVIGPTVLGTDGRGAAHVMIPAGGSRQPANLTEPIDRCLHMNGPEVFSFTLTEVQKGIESLLGCVGRSWQEIDLFLLHQASGFVLEALRQRMGLTAAKCPIDIEETGNTSCAALPILLRRCWDRGNIAPGHRCVLAGFGVGYSWAMTYLEILGGSHKG